MPLFRSNRGSAVVEFIFLAIPALLLFGAGVTMFLNSYIDTVLRSVAVDASRFTSLADQDQISAERHVQEKLQELLPNFKVVATVERSSIARAVISYQPLPNIFSVFSKPVKIESVAPIEK